ncbi:Aspartyl aminopeptidase [Methylophaga frappieri]|uniref:M18 family aminopeptidase n=1 Tax=Methylophaga frappieri (strain ATCC BAA-2434 / DSM 25690 / JAM7) TaxID=754477 RepID=I1YE63_METFJ|nr:M18 family aminopeptidase [Methylophaga frappieri]AFJ01206.1 Aspartyl aminopeptidase [Methylophaga frappieri]
MMVDNSTTFNQNLFSFLDASPTPFHAVQSLVAELGKQGFKPLSEQAAWGTLAAGRYYIIRNGSSLIAFTLPEACNLAEQGVRLLGAHTDSPCLKVKPRPENVSQQLWQLGVEVYGGALLNPWFDRDLSMAGRVSYLDQKGQLQHVLINFQKPLAVIPSLAIHLDREANQNRSINPQQHLPPIIMHTEPGEQPDFRALLEQQIRTEHADHPIGTVMDYEIALYDTQPAGFTGLNNDFISAARLDNLLSCYTGLQALLTASNRPAMLVCNDHEEVGSMSASGAQGNFLQSVLQRLTQTPEQYARMIANSWLISADNAHAIHPNYADRHDAAHGPLLNRGPVIKTNANQRYATNSETAAMFRHLCQQADVPVQDFVVRTDMACGSTIGPLTAGQIGIRTIDIGVPTFAMHSIRELAGSQDPYYLYSALNYFFN